ncbi:unnamed protein product, partial [Oikopleura dioica]
MKRLLLFFCLISVLLQRGIGDQIGRSVSSQKYFVSRLGASRVKRAGDEDHDDHDDDDEDHDDHDDDHEDDDHDHGDEEGDLETWTRAKAFGYASLANAIISLLSLAGIAIVICNQKCIKDKKSQELIFDFFIALGISTMLGDTFFHILPKVMGIHGHEEGSDENGDHAGHSDESHAEEDAKYKLALGRMALTVGMMYLFWILESLTSISNFGGHGHSHGPAPSAPANNVLDVHDEALKPGEVEVRTRDTAGIVGVAVGDVMHNFVDGIAIGVSWRFSWQLGMATTIAIFLHELPHEYSVSS